MAPFRGAGPQWHHSDVQPRQLGTQLGIPAADSRGLVATKHAYEALATRVHGVPALAPYFHFAFGWGVATAFQCLRFRTSLGAALLCVLGGPAIAMIWDPPIRVLHHLFGADQAAGAGLIMSLAFALRAYTRFRQKY